jgi:hypothetical protein
VRNVYGNYAYAEEAILQLEDLSVHAFKSTGNCI